MLPLALAHQLSNPRELIAVPPTSENMLSVLWLSFDGSEWRGWNSGLRFKPHAKSPSDIQFLMTVRDALVSGTSKPPIRDIEDLGPSPLLTVASYPDSDKTKETTLPLPSSLECLIFLLGSLSP